MVWELYDLAADAMEGKNLIETEVERAEALRPRLRKWLESVVRSLNGEDYSDLAGARETSY